MNGVVARDSVESILLLDRVINREQFDKVRLEAVNSGVKPDELLLKHNYASEQAVSRARAELMGVTYINVLETGSSPEALTIVPEAVARKYQALPFSIDNKNNILSVAMANPADLMAADFLENKSGMKIK